MNNIIHLIKYILNKINGCINRTNIILSNMILIILPKIKNEILHIIQKLITLQK